MARVNRVGKCRKAQGNCGGCGDPIKKGDPYIHWSPGFRGSKRRRCTKPGCYPRPSALTANDRLSTVYGAQEDVEDTIKDWDRRDIDALKDAMTEAAEHIREMGEEYQESADTINETAEGSPIAEECEEKANGLSEWADEIESARDDLEEYEGAEECEECSGTGEINCPDCDASEETEKACETCDDSRTVDCTECEGKKDEETEEARNTWADDQADKAENVMGECPV